MTPSDNVVLSYLPKPCSSFANTNAPTDAGTVIQFFVWLVERQVCCAGYTDRAPGKTLGGYLRGGGSLQLDPWLSGWFATPLQGDSKRSQWGVGTHGSTLQRLDHQRSAQSKW